MAEFKWYSDDFNLLRDVYYSMTDMEAMMLQAQTGIELINPIEMAYMNGAKMNLIRAIAKMTAVNRLISLDEKKYLPIFKDRKLVVDYDKLISDSMKPKADHMFQ